MGAAVRGVVLMFVIPMLIITTIGRRGLASWWFDWLHQMGVEVVKKLKNAKKKKKNPDVIAE